MQNTNDVLFAYMHEEINISVLSIFFFFFFFFFRLFYDFNLNTNGFVYLEFVKFQLGLHRNVQVFAMYAYLLYSCFIYKHVQALFLSRNKSCIFPMLGLAKPGPSCSKLTTSLVNDSLKFTSSDTQIF